MKDIIGDGEDGKPGHLEGTREDTEELRARAQVKGGQSYASESGVVHDYNGSTLGG